MSDFDVVVVGASVAGCTAARLYAQRGARVALVEKRPDIDAYKTVCTHYIQPSATPTIEKVGLAPLIEERGAVHNSIDLWTPYGGWIPYRGDTPYGYNVTRQRARSAAAPDDRRDGRRGASGRPHGDRAAQRRAPRRRRRGSRARAPRAARAARRRRRRARLAPRADGRRARPRAAAQPLLLLGVLERRGAGRRPLADVVHGARLRVLVPERGRALPAARGAAPRPSARVPRRSRGRVPALPRRAARRAGSQPRHARVEAAGQARPAERQPPGRTPRARVRRRRRARLRPAVGRRLRLGVPERGLARRGDRRGAHRRRRPRRRARLLPPCPPPPPRPAPLPDRRHRLRPPRQPARARDVPRVGDRRPRLAAFEAIGTRRASPARLFAPRTLARLVRAA